MNANGTITIPNGSIAISKIANTNDGTKFLCDTNPPTWVTVSASTPDHVDFDSYMKLYKYASSNVRFEDSQYSYRTMDWKLISDGSVYYSNLELQGNASNYNESIARMQMINYSGGSYINFEYKVGGSYTSKGRLIINLSGTMYINIDEYESSYSGPTIHLYKPLIVDSTSMYIKSTNVYLDSGYLYLRDASGTYTTSYLRSPDMGSYHFNFQYQNNSNMFHRAGVGSPTCYHEFSTYVSSYSNVYHKNSYYNSSQTYSHYDRFFLDSYGGNCRDFVAGSSKS